MTPARIDEALRFCGRLEVEKTALRCGFRAATRCVGRKAERVAGAPQPGGDENSGVCRLRTIQVSRGEAVLPLHLATGQRARADRPMDRPSGLQPSPGPDIKVRYHARTDVPVRVRIPAGLPRIEFSGTAVVAPATAPIITPRDCAPKRMTILPIYALHGVFARVASAAPLHMMKDELHEHPLPRKADRSHCRPL
jgi:hypothetical protein